MAGQSTSSSTMGTKKQSSFKTATQYIARKAKEHNASVNEAYELLYGTRSVPSSRRTSAISTGESARYA
jgi:hypothetical protein